MKRSKPELLAPAGDWVSLRAAIDAGADAVYFGIKGINMRAGADNFLITDLPKIAKLCHAEKVLCYLAMNTIVYEHELKKTAGILDKVKKAGIDAIIAWDLSVIQAARERGIDVHMSTQMSVSNSSSLSFFRKKLGIKRFVLARECSIEDVKIIKKALLSYGICDAEIEVFAHGAMCVAISGRCFMSQTSFGRSANRGECIQPCRREYDVSEQGRLTSVDCSLDSDTGCTMNTDTNSKHSRPAGSEIPITDKENTVSFRLGNDYVMSPKDLCTIPIIDRLVDAGVDSFKIEGRNRSPEYVKKTVSAYRKMIDWYCENRSRKGKKGYREEIDTLRTEMVKELKEVYNRDFSTGFYMGKPIGEWCDSYGSKATTIKQYVGYVVNHFNKVGVSEIKVESNGFCVGDRIMIQGPTTGVREFIADSIEWHHKKTDAASKGKNFAIKTGFIARKNDKVYVIKEL